MGGAATGCRGRAALPWGLPALPVLLRAGAAPGLLGGGIPPASLTAPRPGGGGIRTDQAPLPITDQILTARAVESLQHQLPVLGLAPLHQCPLEGLVVGRAGDEDRLHGAGVQAGVPHAGRQGAGGGIEVLHLLRHVSLPVEPLRQLDRILQGAAGVGGDEVGDQVLVLAVAAVELEVLLPELFIDLDVWLTHIVQGVGGAVLGRHLQLAGDVVLDQVGEELAAGVLHQKIEPDAGPDEDLFYLGELPQLAQEHHIVSVVGVQVGAGLRRQTGPVPAHTVLELFLAGGTAEGGRGAAHVVDIALEAGVAGEGLCLPENRLVAAGGDGAPLVKGQGAEAARPKAPSVVGDGEAHLLDGGNLLPIHGVNLPDIGQVVQGIQCLPAQWTGRWIHHQHPALTGLQHGAPPDGIVLVVLDLGGSGVGRLVGAHLLIGGTGHRMKAAALSGGCNVGGAGDVGDLTGRHLSG